MMTNQPSETKEERIDKLWQQIAKCSVDRFFCLTKIAISECCKCSDYPCELVKEHNKALKELFKARGQREVQEI